jgi:hypothetical protein
MRKTILVSILLAIGVSFNLIAQHSSLYDVNYDEPQNTVQYNQANDTFQRIFLQYESAITAAGEVIRQEEKARYAKEIEDIQRAEKIRADNTIEEMRREIYGNEVEAVRTQEIERLTAELTEKISKELNEKLSSQYEEKKNTEIAQLYKNLKQEAYTETEATSKRIKYIAVAVAFILIVLLMIGLMILTIRKFKIKNKESKDEKETFDSLVQEYSTKLKKHGGDSYSIISEINSSYSDNKKEKNRQMKALKEAENRYTPDPKDIEDYRGDFSGYQNSLSNYIKGWKNDNTKQIFEFIKQIYRNYSRTGDELYHSIDFRLDADKQAAKHLLKETANILNDFCNSIDREEVEKEFIKAKQNLVQDFKNLVKRFEEYAK